MDIDSVFFSLFGHYVLRARLKPLFESLRLNVPATKMSLNDPRELETIQKFFDGLGLIRKVDAPFTGLVTDITHIAKGGGKRGYEVHTFYEQGRSLDDWEKFLYARELHQFSSDLNRAEKEFTEVILRLDGENRDFLRFDQSNSDNISFYRWSWNPNILMWAESDGAHRMFKLRYLSRLLNKKIVLKNHIRTFLLDERLTKEFLKDNWFLIPDHLENAEAINRIWGICASSIPRYSSNEGIFPVHPQTATSFFPCQYCLNFSFNNCSFRLLRLKPQWNLDSLARQTGLFSFNSFIAELLSKQQKACLEDFRQ